MKKIIAAIDQLSLLKSGIIGFITFLVVIILLKLFSSLLGTNNFLIEFQDIAISSMGFIFAILIKVFEKYSHLP